MKHLFLVIMILIIAGCGQHHESKSFDALYMCDQYYIGLDLSKRIGISASNIPDDFENKTITVVFDATEKIWYDCVVSEKGVHECTIHVNKDWMVPLEENAFLFISPIPQKLRLVGNLIKTGMFSGFENRILSKVK